MTDPVLTRTDSRLFRAGALHGVAGLVVATLIATIIAAPNWADNETAARMAIVGVVLFALALAIGSSRVIGATSFPVLGSAFIVSATSETMWVQSIVVGCLWYIAVELAWESVDRRTWARRSTSLGLRRVNEVATVVVVSLAVTVTAFAGSSLDAARTLPRQAFIVIALLVALGFAIRRIVATAPAAGD